MTMYEKYCKTLALRQGRQGTRQTGLDVRGFLSWGFRIRDATTHPPVATRRTLTDSIEIAGRVRHGREPVAVLPRVRHHVAPDLDPALPPVPGDEDLTEPLLDISRERPDRTLSAASLAFVGCRHTQRNPGAARLRHRQCRLPALRLSHEC